MEQNLHRSNPQHGRLLFTSPDFVLSQNFLSRLLHSKLMVISHPPPSSHVLLPHHFLLTLDACPMFRHQCYSICARMPHLVDIETLPPTFVTPDTSIPNKSSLPPPTIATSMLGIAFPSTTSSTLPPVSGDLDDTIPVFIQTQDTAPLPSLALSPPSQAPPVSKLEPMVGLYARSGISSILVW